ncbi:DNA-3-methyladenine glycosylase 2 family protein [Sphingosinicellaceae bacterium]|nr:DNA-3-methyladenine glycosylase 2 family protein [Sphingosinicellaceae bacterium]
MGLSADALRRGIDYVADQNPLFAAALVRLGYPEPRINQRGATTMMRAIVGQQVSVASAAAVWNKFEALVGDTGDFPRIATMSDEYLRTAGLSRQKASYIRSLAGLVATGALDFAALPEDDEDAIAALVAVKGIGRWSAEIYLLFAEGRPDIWPAGDLAIQIAIGQLLGLEARPTEKETRALAEPFRPHRGALAVFCWHHYNIIAI